MGERDYGASIAQRFQQIILSDDSESEEGEAAPVVSRGLTAPLGLQAVALLAPPALSDHSVDSEGDDSASQDELLVVEDPTDSDDDYDEPGAQAQASSSAGLHSGVSSRTQSAPRPALEAYATLPTASNPHTLPPTNVLASVPPGHDKLESFLASWRSELAQESADSESDFVAVGPAYHVAIPDSANLVANVNLPPHGHRRSVPATAPAKISDPAAADPTLDYLYTVVRQDDEVMYIPRRGYLQQSRQSSLKATPPPTAGSQGLLTVGLLDMPDQVLDRILQRLSFVDMMACAQTCRRLYEACQRQRRPWQCLDFGRVENGATDALCHKALVHIDRRRLPLQELHLHDCPALTDAALAGCGAHATSLHTLILTGCDAVCPRWPLNPMEDSEKQCHRTQAHPCPLHPQISDLGVSRLLSQCPLLRSLDVRRCANLSATPLLQRA
ncbi:uncharacterized protein MONBRDRAFT_5203 [Monosiga brevicollis MX1]|uniref:F-box domain-containing protein n=1 Tax=Monosiga brevicollis TaxID=81824 RepID=A9UQ87_MONBE|nr:uncharacterized protein MONBRDRAFT_5203 [Monosiga brevicollis MX1]EDQ93004.1 predicted protein [Monosiga brevicollis MX1]|eukprot:XP_001742766.1 hypothetical protein [Monosiga brevicollis MX1]